MRESGVLTMRGSSVLRAWERGVIDWLMFLGHSLREAQEIATQRGKLAYINQVNNLVVTVGKGLAGDILIGEVSTGLTYHAIGTGTTTPAAGDTTLTTESNRLAVTSKTRAGNVITLSTFFVAAECTYNIKEAGIFGDQATGVADSGTLFCHYLQSYDNSGGSYDLTFDYDLTIS